MYNILIAEDELLIRMGLEASIPWNELGFHIVATASDGEKAWDAYQRYHPEILITDIRMPKLDGLELIRRIRKEDKQCKIIIITCIEYFDALYQSFDFDITGHLLKANMTYDNLYKLLNQIKTELDSTQKALPNDSPFDFSISDWLRKYMIDRTISLSELIANTPNLRINSSEQCHLLTVYFGFVNKTLFQSLTSILKESLAVFGDSMVLYGDDRIYIFMQPKQSLSFETITSVMDHLCAYIENFFSMSLRYTFSPATKFSSLPTITDISNHFIDQPYFFPDQGIYINGKEPYCIPFNSIESLRSNLSCYAFFEGNVSTQYSQLLDCLKDSYGTDRSTFITQLSRLVSFISGFCFSKEKKELLNCFSADSYNNAPEALHGLQTMIPNYSPNPLYIADMLKTIHYIHDHYQEPISVSKLAQMLHVSPNYYAILFRKVTDFNFTDFLTGIRMYHACRLLRETALPISYIADSCGFSDAAYFSKIFKQFYQITPRQYRAAKGDKP